MNDSPSQYGGLAAVFVLGIGLLIVGFSLPVESHEQAVGMRWAGAVVLILALLVLSISIFGSPVNGRLFVSVVAMICSGALIYSAARSEITGKTVYHRNFLGRHGWRTEPVTREDSAAKFREATNVRWGLSAVCAMVSIGSFVYYRKTEYCDDF